MFNIDLNYKKCIKDIENYTEKGESNFRKKLKDDGGQIIKDVVKKYVPESDISSASHYHMKDNIIDFDLTGDEVANVGFSDKVDYRVHFPDVGTNYQEAQLFSHLIDVELDKRIDDLANDIFEVDF